jgi:hypothetical protein
MTARQIEDLANRLTSGEILELRAEAARRDESLPAYLEVIIRSRHDKSDEALEMRPRAVAKV